MQGPNHYEEYDFIMGPRHREYWRDKMEPQAHILVENLEVKKTTVEKENERVVNGLINDYEQEQKLNDTFIQ